MPDPERESMRDKLVPVEPGGLGPCGDGRKAKDGRKLRGPKILGGELGKAALGLGKGEVDTVEESDIRLVCRRTIAAGFTPSVHGDKEHGEEGCGFGRLWKQGKLSGLPKLNVSLARVKEIVLEEGGEYVELIGSHEEQFVAVNYVENMTLEPDGSYFIVDAWAAELFGIDRERMLANAAEVVKKLPGPDRIEVIK